LAFAVLRFRPPPQEQIEFFFAPDKLRQAARVESIEAALNRAGPQCSPRPYRLGDALDLKPAMQRSGSTMNNGKDETAAQAAQAARDRP
jgi:hypothetical protein